jgi:hypothetical protein
MKKILWLIVPAFLLVGCPQPEPDAPKVVVKDDIKMCPAACEHAASLGCFEAQPLVFKDTCEADADCNLGVCIEGQCTETCVMTCEGLVTEGVTMGLECWQTITDCRQIESVCR